MLDFQSTDILCGKDKSFAKHSGNQVFAEVIDSYKEAYENLPNKQQKMLMTRQIVQEMKTKYNARFIRLSGRHWKEISEALARDKVSHALRFALKKSRKMSCDETTASESDDMQIPEIPKKIGQFEAAPLASLTMTIDGQCLSLRSLDSLFDSSDLFDTLRSEDLNAIMDDPMIGTEYSIALSLAAEV